jgi:hypothetical protein
MCRQFQILTQRSVLVLLALSWLASGCAVQSGVRPSRPFAFSTDTFSYANELVWEYHRDPVSGKMRVSRRDPPGEYTHHCFVMARATRQFFFHARFDLDQPRLHAENYRARIKKVLRRHSTSPSVDAEKVVFPGYGSLHEFSQDWGRLLKAHAGGAWRSYFQRGHWRMVFPFSGRHQDRTAAALRQSLLESRPPLIHVVRFPSLAINHALLLFDSEELNGEILFKAYDPNNPREPLALTFNPQRREFRLPPLDYFGGGRVAVYEIYRNWCY